MAPVPLQLNTDDRSKKKKKDLKTHLMSGKHTFGDVLQWHHALGMTRSLTVAHVEDTLHGVLMVGCW